MGKTNEFKDGSQQTESRFRLIMVVALRAKQLLHGATPRVEVDVLRRKHTSIAMEEVRRGLVHSQKVDSVPSQRVKRVEGNLTLK